MSTNVGIPQKPSEFLSTVKRPDSENESVPFVSRLWEVWCHPWPLPPRLMATLVWLFAGYCAALVYVGASHTNLFGHDYFIFLDSGWRLLTGQRPHIDFHTAQGPILSLYSGLAMKAGGGNLSLGFGIARALVTAVFTIWCFRLLRNRVAPAAAIAICFMLALLAGAPSALTSSPLTQSMAMFYNRFGYVLLALIIVESFGPLPSSFLRGFSSGLAASLLLFLKISFLGVALGVLAVSLLFSNPRWPRMAGIVTGFLLATTGFLIWLGFHIGAIQSDLHTLAIIRAAAFPRARFLRTINDSFPGMLWTLSLGAIVFALNWRAPKSLLQKLQPLALALLAVVCEPVVGITNQQNTVYILMSVCGLLLLASLAHTSAAHNHPMLGAVLILGLCLPAAGCIYDLSSMAMTVEHAIRHAGARGVPRIDTPELSSLVFEGEVPQPYRYENGSPLVDAVNDGIHLLRANTPSTDRVLTLGFVNPFPVSLQRPAPRGSWVWFCLDYNITNGNYPPASTLFAEADAVMVPKYDSEAKPTTDALVAEYKPTLENDYVLKAESAFWLLYTKRSAAPGTADARSAVQAPGLP